MTEMELFYFWQKEAGNYHVTEIVERWAKMPQTTKQALLEKWKIQQESKN